MGFRSVTLPSLLLFMLTLLMLGACPGQSADYPPPVEDAEPLPLSSAELPWDPDSIALLTTALLDDDEPDPSKPKTVRYYGNADKLLPLVDFNTDRNPAAFMPLPPGLLVPVDETGLGAHRSRFEIEAPRHCQPEFELVTLQEGTRRTQQHEPLKEREV